MSHETEILLTCPYNPAHTILKARMLNHLCKCRKQHENQDWVTCPFNVGHHMPKSELDFHTSTMCEFRFSHEAAAFQLDNVPTESLAPVQHLNIAHDEPSWDDGPVNNFNPEENAKAKALIRGVHNVPPAARRAFRLEHREHIQEKDIEVTTVEKLRTQPQPKKTQEKKQNPLEPLRAPLALPKGFNIGRGSKITSDTQSSAASDPSPSPSPRVAAPEAEPAISHRPPVEWTGLGRGRPVMDAVAAPVQGAWGRGTLKF